MQNDALGVDGVHVTGYFGREMGLGVAARGYVRALDHLGIPVARHDLTHHKGSASEPSTMAITSVDSRPHFAVNLICANAREHFRVVRELGEAHFLNRSTIGVWAWELPRFPAEWHDRFTWYDEIWVGSSFVANALAPVSPVPVIRIPPVVEPIRLGSRAKGREHLRVADDEYVFLFVFSFHSVFERKNPLALIDAFARAFSPAEPARLVIKCVNEDYSPDSLARMQTMAKGRRISIHTGYWEPDQMRDAMAACDAYVSLHRAEGFGLTIAEAMARGKPVIATAWSGNTDFMNVSNSFPVRHELVDLERDFGPYRAGETWAEPSVAHAAELMRRVCEDRDEARARGLVAQAEIASSYATERVARLVQERFAVIGRRRAGRPIPSAISVPVPGLWHVDAARAPEEPLGIVLYVVGGVEPNGNPALRTFPRVNRRPGESQGAHLARVTQLVTEAIKAGGTHVVVPRQRSDWLRDHPRVADYFAANHELAEADADAEAGVVFRLLSPASPAVDTTSKAGSGARGKKAKSQRAIRNQIARLEQHVDRLAVELRQSRADRAALAEQLARAQPIVDAVPAIGRAVAAVTRTAEELDQRLTQHAASAHRPDERGRGEA